MNFVLISFVSTYIQTDRAHNRRGPASDIEEAPAPVNADTEELSPETQSLIADVYARIEMLQSAMPQLHFRLNQALNDIDLADRRTIVSNLQTEIRSHQREIKKLKRKLQSLEGLAQFPDPLP